MSSDRIGTFFHKEMETFINNTRQQQVVLKELVADSQELRRFIDEALQAAEKNQPELVRLTESSTHA